MRTSRPARGSRPAARFVTATVVALLLAVLTAWPAAAQAQVDEVVSALRTSPVFVDPEVRGSVSQDELQSRVDAADTPSNRAPVTYTQNRTHET